MLRYVASASAMLAISISLGATPARAQSAPADDVLPSNFVIPEQAQLTGNSIAAGGVLGRKSTGGVLGVDSLTNWSSYFYVADNNGGFQFTWPYTMVGNSPFARNTEHDHDGNEGGVTFIPSPIVPVTVQLLDTDGSVRIFNGHQMVSTSTQFVDPVLRSPAFSPSSYSSSNLPTQFTDAVQRAEFFHLAGREWHTVLAPRVLPARTMRIPRGKYQFAPNADGTCCRLILVDADTFVSLLFPPTSTDTSTIMGAVENAHQISTADLSIFLFNNVFLFQGTQCCILGFHSYDVEPGSVANGFREKRYVMSYASWITSGLFRDPTVADVTALSHELAETFNDPFVNNLTPWWLGPNGNCQNDLETGDVIEGVPNSQIAIRLNGFTYHPQNEALIQWFADMTPSTAIDGAYSYPDTTVLTSPNKPQNPNCTPPR